MHRRTFPIAAWIALDVLRSATTAHAEEPAPSEAALTDGVVSRRVSFLESRLRAESPSANAWWFGWLATWSALAVGEGVLAIATTNAGLRTDSIVGSASSALGVVPLLVFPFPARSAAGKLERTPAGTPDERRQKLARGEALLEESARAEEFGRSWISHLLVGVASAGVGVVLGVGLHRPGSGVLDGLGGVALGEGQIFTQPTAAIDAWREYRADPSRPTPTGLVWTVVPRAGGLGIVGSF